MAEPITQTVAPQTASFENGETFSNTGVAQNSAAQGALGNLGVTGNTYTGYVPPKPAVYPVVSADLAKNDLANKQANFTQIQNGMVGQQQVNQQNAANSTANGQVQAQADAENAKADALNKATGALTPDTAETPKTTEQLLQEQNDKADAAYDDYKTQIDSVRNGTFPLSPDEQAQIDYVQKQLDTLRQQQITANNNYQGGITQLGIVSGRQRYAPEIQTGEIANAVNVGIQKIADIEAQAANTISTLRQGFKDNNYKLINSSYDALNNYLTQKTNTIKDIAQNVRDEAQLALSKHSSEVNDAQLKLQQEKQELDKQQAATQFALDNNVTQPFYLIGNTAIDSKTGLPVSLEEYQRATGQTGKTEEETDFSKIQKVRDPNETKTVADLINKYSDAGIKLSDTPEQASSKIKNSRIYRKETYIAPTASTTPDVANATLLELSKYTGQDGKVDPQAYQTLRAASKLSASEFDNRFGYTLSPQEQKNLGITSSAVAKPATDVQNQEATYADRVKQSSQTIDTLANDIAKYNQIGFYTQSKLPNAQKSTSIQQYEQASRNLINSILRKESGAAISQSEFDNAYAQYLPRPGDSPDVLSQKKQNRDTVLQGLIRSAGPAYTGDSTQNDSLGGSQVIEYNGKRYQVDSNGNFDENKPLN